VSAETPPLAGVSGLSASEVRVLGCLLEKQRTTPDMYPLTLNGLRLACNQSTNRDPVVDYDDATVRDALHRLERRGFTRLASGRGSRAPKYRHLLAEAMPMEEDEQALMSALMLRGAQTPGELKQRAERMHRFASLEEVHDVLARLAARGLLARQERRPGQKEERYVQLLEDRSPADGLVPADLDSPSSRDARDAGEPTGPNALPPRDGGAADAPAWVASLHERLARLEREVADLRADRADASPAISGQTASGPGE
jgi:uncharacterized protein YceH (UPF0502 family)